MRTVEAGGLDLLASCLIIRIILSQTKKKYKNHHRSRSRHQQKLRLVPDVVVVVVEANLIHDGARVLLPHHEVSLDGAAA